MKYIYNECISPAELLMVGWQFNSQIHSSAGCTLMQSDTVKAYIVENRGKCYETLSNFKKVSCKRGGLLQSLKTENGIYSWKVLLKKTERVCKSLFG